MKNKIPIVFAFDNNLITPAIVCLTSLLENSKASTYYDIYIIHSSKTTLNKSPFKQFCKIYHNCNITFREVSSQFDSSYEVRGISASTYYRLLIPDLILEYDKVLYSDVDVIFRDDLTEFYNQDIDGYYLGAVDNCSFIRPDVQKYIRNELGLDPQKGYFYAGNIVMNTALMRSDNIVESFKSLSYKKYNQQDMDIINIVCNGRIKALSPAFCVTNYIYELILKRKTEMLTIYSEQDLHNALTKGIVHYNGPKPWKQWCQNFDIWWYYYRKSFIFSEYDAMFFYLSRMSDIDSYSLMKRVKLLLKYFIRGIRTYNNK